jgi:polyisoprenoid-binding protein YceI
MTAGAGRGCGLLIATLLVSAYAIPQPLRAEESMLELDPTQTRVEFTLHDVLHTVHGTFHLKRGMIRFDPETGLAKGELIVDAQSGDSGSEARDSRMHKNILESRRYPEIVFLPDRVEGKVLLSGPSQVKLHGAFRIHGADHEITLPVQVQIGQSQVTARTSFEVPYVKWGMKNPSTFFLRVSDRVRIDIQAAGRLSTPGR